MRSSVGRPRSSGRKDWPDNLIPRHRRTGGKAVVYYYWRDPRDGLEKSLRCPGDFATAKRRAIELNSLVTRERAEAIVQELAGQPTRRATQGTPFDAFAVHCLRTWEARGLAPNTLRSRKSLVNAMAACWRDRPLHTLEVVDCAQLLREYAQAGKARTAQALRAVGVDLFRQAHEQGLLPHDHPNPMAMTARPVARVRRARLTLEPALEILRAAERLARGAWVAHAILLALVSGQRREDLARAQFRRGRDWDHLWEAWIRAPEQQPTPYPFVEDGLLWVVQGKTGALVRIPLSLYLEAVGLSLGEIIERCRGRIATPYLLHHDRPFGNAPVGAPIHIDTISRAFADARALTGLQWPGQNPPTFHELRSLSERLYKAQGLDTQTLLGHRHARMTEVYHDPRRAEWRTVSL